MNAINELTHYQELFDKYAKGMTEGVAEYIVQTHTYPWILVKGEEHIVVEKPELFELQFLFAKGLLEQQGVVSFQASINKILAVTERNRLVNVSWGFKSAEGGLLRTVSTSYLFLNNDGEEKVMSVVIDDDNDLDVSLFG